MEIQRYLTPFNLYKRKLSKGVFYYARFRDAAGKWTSGIFTGQTSKPAAAKWAQEQLDKASRNVQTLAEYADGFFDDGGKYDTSEKLFSARGVGRPTMRQHRFRTAEYILPALGALRIDEIKSDHIRHFQIDLSKRLSSQSVSHIINTVSILLNYAAEDGIIDSLPVFKRVTVRHNHRGVLSVEEAQMVLRAEWPDQRQFMLNFLAACTGMRLGELLALRWAAIREDHIEVFATWNETDREVRGSRNNPVTKAGRMRIVPLPMSCKILLGDWRRISPFNDDDQFVFAIDKTRPVKAWSVPKVFAQVLSSVGVSESERMERHIDFHSWRHFYNSMLVNGRIPITKVQAAVGHTSERMTANYFHADDWQDVIGIVDGVIKKPGV